MINRAPFYNYIREHLFSGHLTGLQVDGIEDLLNEWELHNIADSRQLACILANIYYETNKTMQPIKEFGGEAYLRSKPYYPYFGRDLLQTTWNYNYEKVKNFSGIDVVSHPELIGQMPLAAKVAITFMLHGWYTGKKVGDYFNNDREDWYNSRRIINGIDRAKEVAEYGMEFYHALSIN